jgi:hypothetical protein
MNKILTITAILMTAIFASSVLADPTTLYLCKKDTTTWQCIETGIYRATLTFDPISPTFKGTLTTWGLGDSTNYALIYKPDKANRFVDWNGAGGIVIATFTGAQSKVGLAIDKDLEMNLPNTGDWNINPSPDYCLKHNTFDSYVHCKGAKLWIVPTSDLTDDSKLPLDAWTPSTYLFEEDLITYLDSSLSIGYVNVKCTQLSDCPTGQTCVDSACTPISCGITATGSIIFGDMVQGTGLQSGQTSTITNTGNVLVTPKISGDYWYGSQWVSGNKYWMPVEQTQWYVSNWNILTSTPTSIGALPNTGNFATVSYYLTVPAQQPTDSYSQILTFTATC